MTEHVLTENQVDALARMADVLIPRDGVMPSGGEAGIRTKWLDRVLELRSDLVSDLIRAIDVAANVPSVKEIKQQLGGDVSAWAALTTVASSAYFLNPDVQRRLGYPGQGPQHKNPDEVLRHVADGLLDPVLERWTP